MVQVQRYELVGKTLKMGSTSSVEADVKIEKEIQPSASSMTHNSDDVEVGDSQNKKAEDTDVVENAADTNDGLLFMNYFCLYNHIIIK